MPPAPAGPPSEHFWGSQRGDLWGDAVTSWTLQHQRDLRGAELRRNASQCWSTYTLPLLFLTFLKYANMNDFSPLSVTSLSHQRWYFNPFSWWAQILHDFLFVERDLLTIYLPATYPRCRGVCWMDLEKFNIAPLAHQWILCSEWVPSEWESKLLIKSQGIHTTPVHQLIKSCEAKICVVVRNKSIIKAF